MAKEWLDSTLHNRLAVRLVALPPHTKAVIVALADLMILGPVALVLAWYSPSPNTLFAALVFAAVAAFGTITALAVFGVYRAVVRFISSSQWLGIVSGCAIGGTLAQLALLVGRLEGIDWESLALYISGGASLLITTRGLAAYFLRPARNGEHASGANHVVIYGAGEAGAQLAAALRFSEQFRPIAFVDDSRENQGRSLLGIPVLAPAKLPVLKARGKFSQILLAIPSLRGERQRRLLESLAPLAVKVRVMPKLEDLASGRQKISELRDVQVEDLLSRDCVAPFEDLLDQPIRGKAVMVTGAAGSIGSELCRQALARGATKLILLDQSECGLYHIHRELRATAAKAGCKLVPALGSVTDESLMRRLLQREHVETLYHAAAYKHVPLVERNVLPAVTNNVFGTLTTLRAAITAGVANFVLISTDKAVRPVGIMGATKRICELIVQALAAEHERPRMSMVRFGNVMASSGSVIPLFQEQIRNGGPVTVTHPEVTRYFMTIAEAAQLVIQAGALGEQGDVFVLDMGEPVKILELAVRMIHLSGLEVRTPEKPDGDIAIEFTGLRSGEKLYEELLIGENPQQTAHPRIFKAHEVFMPWIELEDRLHALKAGVVNGDLNLVVRMVHTLANSTPPKDQTQPTVFEKPPSPTMPTRLAAAP